MLDWITHLMNSLDYPAIVFLMALENVFPSELVMPLAGFTATQGELSLPGVIAAGTFGAVLNALPPLYLPSLCGVSSAAGGDNTDKSGDGRVFVIPIEATIKIRSGERENGTSI